MTFKDFLNTLKDSQTWAVVSDGSLTTDKPLLSLRRQQRLFNEREEKIRLRKKLRDRAMSNDRQIFSSSPIKESRTILSKLPKDRSKKFMSAKSTIFS